MNTGYLLGYDGFCTMTLRSGDLAGSVSGGAQTTTAVVPVINGTYTRTMTVPLTSTFSAPLNMEKRGKIRTTYGVCAYGGKISFELTDQLSNIIFGNNGFFERRSFLDLTFWDAQGQINIPGAVWKAFSITGEIGKLIKCDLEFQSCNGYQHDITQIPGNGTAPAVLPGLEPYWRYGGSGLVGFTLSFSRNVKPIYLNEKGWAGPSYLRVGLMDASFAGNCTTSWLLAPEITLNSKTLKFTHSSFASSQGYSYTGTNGEGKKTYTNNAASLKGDQDLFTII